MITISTFINPKIFTIGYEGVSIEEFIGKLIEKKIQRIIDVRCNPISRKKGFSKKALQTKLQDAGIRYAHLPELGIPSSLRKSLQTDNDYSSLFEHYNEHILPHATEKINEAIALLEEMPSAFLCFEKDPQYCHRTHLAHYIARKTNFAEITLQVQ
jgi:uncharacterized protein (DUF488 family)